MQTYVYINLCMIFFKHACMIFQKCMCKFHLPFSYSVFSYFISASATVCYFVTSFFRSATRVVICCYSRTREGEFVFGVYLMYLIVQYIYIEVIIGLVLWRACDHLKVINLFLFYRSADDFVNRQFVVVFPHYFPFIIYTCAPALH